jgi:Aldo/keto reductase family
MATGSYRQAGSGVPRFWLSNTLVPQSTQLGGVNARCRGGAYSPWQFSTRTSLKAARDTAIAPEQPYPPREGQSAPGLTPEHGVERLSEIEAFTKWVPAPGRMIRRVVDDAIGISLSRMGVECLDLLQFHWWDYNDKSYLEALKYLADLQHEGRIRHLALTNFDTERLGVIADRFHIVSNQVQYSLTDRRAESRMTSFCREHSITLLAYGTLLGGLLSKKYLGRPEPDGKSSSPPHYRNTRT